MLAQIIRAPGLERPPALCGAPHLRQLESNDRKESALCCPPTWAQRRDHVPNLCSLDAGCPESNIRLIRSAMKAKKSASGAKPGRESHLRIAPVARLATGLATGNVVAKRKTLEFTAKRSGGEGGSHIAV